MIHLIEDHAKRVDVPVRFAASKLIEGDEQIQSLLNLDQNETEMLEHIKRQLETERESLKRIIKAVNGLIRHRQEGIGIFAVNAQITHNDKLQRFLLREGLFQLLHIFRF